MAIIQITQRQGRLPVTVFQLLESINSENCSEFDHAVQETYDAGMRDLVIDLSQIESLPSAGLRSIAIAHKLLSTDGKKHLKLAGLSFTMHNILGVTGFDRTIDVYDTVDEAVASF